MKNFVGIDLGTTNSAICSYDGSEARIWKSPEQNDVTPSVILIDRRGNKYLGNRAYNSAPWQDGNAALLFKRIMGTSTPVQLPAINLTMSPEECSSEILKLLFGYLSEEMRNDPDIATVITVPAVFNQMQKDATMQAAQMAGIGKVALMQEPVAAVMSVMRARNVDGMFLIYDLGGGTLDIAIAESMGGRVNLLAHGGIAMCGGRDFDRVLVDNIVKPWILENFDLPDDVSVNPKFKTLIRVASWATEKAKIELSAKEETAIMLSEDEMRCRDLSGNDIYLEIPMLRETFDKLIAERVNETIDAARETLSKAGLTSHDLERIVFVGGPTNYKPLRGKVAFELGIPGSMDVNPMTAVAEGASLFAESIDWSTQNRSRKNTRGQISSGGNLSLTFNYIARTPGVKAKIAVQLADQVTSISEFQIDSIDTGWTSGRLPLKHGVTLDVTLTKNGENTFKVFVFDSVGGPISLEQNKIVITRTATVDAIPASHSIGIEVLEKLGGRPVLHWLVRAGDSLPRKGKTIFKAAECLKSGDSDSLNFKLWEGEIEDSIHDNRFIGVLKISGKDFDTGVIPAGGTLECDFEILDSGNVVLDVSIPDIKGVRSGNFYSWQGIDYSSEGGRSLVVEEGDKTLQRLDEIAEVVENPKLEPARKKLESAVSLDPQETDPETAKEAHEKIFEARNILAQVRKEHLKEIRQIELDRVVLFFDEHVRQHARPSEATTFDNLAKTAQRSIGNTNDKDFEHYLDELKGRNFEILWRQDWFVVERFKSMINSPRLFADMHRFEELSKIGMQLMRSDDIDKLRQVVAQLYQIMVRSEGEDDMFEVTNIIKG
jgi:molecular chaperone DnaK